MTEWDAAGYSRVAALQAAMADEVLALLKVKGDERVLDLGCGSGKVTAEIAARLGNGSILGVDSSAEMIAFAEKTFLRPHTPISTFDKLTFAASTSGMNSIWLFLSTHFIGSPTRSMPCSEFAPR